MKTKTGYILIFLLAAALLLLFITGHHRKQVFDDRITLRKQDKIPYGTWVARQNLTYLFPLATIYSSRLQPGYWDSISVDDPGQAFISISENFNADEFEMGKLISFAENGNDVFISAKDISFDAEKIIFSAPDKKLNQEFLGLNREYQDSLSLVLVQPHYASYAYPGKNFSRTFRELNLRTTEILGKDGAGYPNFIHLRAGKGNFYIHRAPLAFSNYFLLHRNNIGYYETALSVIGAGTRKIIWDEYYLNKRDENGPRQRKKSWVTVLFRYPALRAGLLVAIFTLLLFTLLEARRKQREIPLIAKPRNDSLDFVRTIGRLYYEKGNHRNLGRKMSSYFLEHVRTVYKLPTSNLGEVFIKDLQYKSGFDAEELRGIVSFMKYVEDAPAISAGELKEFYGRLEAFYKK